MSKKLAEYVAKHGINENQLSDLKRLIEDEAVDQFLNKVEEGKEVNTIIEDDIVPGDIIACEYSDGSGSPELVLVKKDNMVMSVGTYGGCNFKGLKNISYRKVVIMAKKGTPEWKTFFIDILNRSNEDSRNVLLSLSDSMFSDIKSEIIDICNTKKLLIVKDAQIVKLKEQISFIEERLKILGKS